MIQPVETGYVHRVDSLVEELGGLSQDLRHRARLQLAQLDQDRPVGDLQTGWVGQVKQLAEHDLDDHVLERNLRLEGITQKLGRTEKIKT